MIAFFVKMSRSTYALLQLSHAGFLCVEKSSQVFWLQGLTTQERKRVSSCFKLGNMPKIVRNWFLFLFLSKLLTVNVSCHRLTCSILQILAPFWYHFFIPKTAVSSLLRTYLPSQEWSDHNSFDSRCPMSAVMRSHDKRSRKEAYVVEKLDQSSGIFLFLFLLKTEKQGNSCDLQEK
jgi:hypothetical protein